MHLNERAVNTWYLLAILASVPGIMLYFGGVWFWRESLWTAPVLTIAGVLALSAGVLGFANRRNRKDLVLAAATVLYAWCWADLLGYSGSSSLGFKMATGEDAGMKKVATRTSSMATTAQRNGTAGKTPPFQNKLRNGNTADDSRRRLDGHGQFVLLAEGDPWKRSNAGPHSIKSAWWGSISSGH